jgi:hypothetical protein
VKGSIIFCSSAILRIQPSDLSPMILLLMELQ